jgi:DNA-binding LacI/PurR family transcriptional regulator
MQENKRITIQDVADAAGVSKQTVSRVINGKPDVSSETRQRIHEIIDRLGYQPDPIARSMRGSTRTLGCITPNLSDYNFSRIVQFAQAEARSQGFFLLTGSAQYESDMQPLLSEIINRRVDGLLVINPRDDGRYKHLLPFIEASMPVVYIKNTPVNEPVSAVCLDDEKGGYLATRHLLELGHRHVATILGPLNEECTVHRLAGYRRALEEAMIDFDPKLVIQGDWSAESGCEAIQSLMNGMSRLSAVFAQNDQKAVGAISQLRENGQRIPEDVSVIGYDDIPLTSFFDPPLTTIHQPIDRFGSIGAQLLIETVNDHDFSPKIIRLEPELIIRASCAPVPPEEILNDREESKQ